MISSALSISDLHCERNIIETGFSSLRKWGHLKVEIRKKLTSMIHCSGEGLTVCIDFDPIVCSENCVMAFMLNLFSDNAKTISLHNERERRKQTLERREFFHHRET